VDRQEGVRYLMWLSWSCFGLRRCSEVEFELFEQVDAVVGKTESRKQSERILTLRPLPCRGFIDIQISIALSVLPLDWARSVTAFSSTAALGQSTRSTPIEDRPTFFIECCRLFRFVRHGLNSPLQKRRCSFSQLQLTSLQKIQSCLAR
jgi:hypothetical protein